MIASLYNPVIQRGGTWSVGLSSKDANGTPKDFSEYDSMRIQVRPAWVGKPGTVKNTPLLSLTTENGRISVATTTITLTLTAEETAALSFNSGKYELEMIKDAVVDPPTAEVVDKLLYGVISITGEIVL